MPNYIVGEDVVSAIRKAVADGAPNVFLATMIATGVKPCDELDGKWELCQTSIRKVKKTNIPEAVCSLCGKRFCDIINSVTLYRFCPNCGAKMDGEEDRE